MAVRINFDNTNTIIEPTFVLATRSGRKLGPIRARNVTVSDSFNDAFELEFKVDKYDNDKRDPMWDEISDFRLIWCKDWDVWFEMYTSVRDDNDTTKSVTCISVGEAELSQINLYEIEINTEDDIARDDYVPTVLYNRNHPEGSLLNRIMEKAPHYTIGHVDNSVANMQRTFSFDDTTIYDAFQEIAEELDCLFVIDSGTNDNGDIARVVNVYDLESYCVDCGHRHPHPKYVERQDGSADWTCPDCGSTNILMGYGDDTTIFVSSENLADEITFKTDTDSVKNCFRLEAGDDLMTAAVMSNNPNGSQYIWYINDEMRRDMSQELVDKLYLYDQDYEYYDNEHEVSLQANLVSRYNDLINKYRVYDDSLTTVSNPMSGFSDLTEHFFETIDFVLLLQSGLKPAVSIASTNAATEAAKLTRSALSPVAVQKLSSTSSTTASSAVLAMAKTIVDPRFQVKVATGAMSGYTWTGTFTVTNYSDDTDTATSDQVNIQLTEDFESFTKQKIERMLAKENDEAYDVPTLFSKSASAFGAELKKYSLKDLQTFYDIGQSCLDILIEQGVSDRKTWANQNPDLYTELYLDYYNKMLAIESEIALREDEIDTVEKLQNEIVAERKAIQDELNFEDYLGEELWLEFAKYRREDTYSNSNFISDGLNNKQLMENADEFLSNARKEIFKSATLQHSLSASLHNLLVIKEFEPIVNYFAVGNWLRVRIDEKVYRLRLIYYSIDFDNIEGIDVEFSDVMECADGISDVESVLRQASSMATSYDAVMRQASKGAKGNSLLSGWVDNGLALTKTKIVDNADNQNMMMDSHGVLMREYYPITDAYSDKQLKIINRGLYITDDNWLTSKAGIGDFLFYNPETQRTEEAYGVIADTLVGNLILSEKVGVYNEKNSVTMDDSGLTITADGTDQFANDVVMNIRKKVIDGNGNEIYKPLMYLDENGNLVIDGSVKIQASSNPESGTLGALDDGLTDVTTKVAEYKADLDEFSTHIESNYVTTTAFGDTLANYPTVNQMNSTIDQRADSITSTVTETATALATANASEVASGLINEELARTIGVFDASKTQNANGTLTFTAHVIRGGSDVVSMYPSNSFQWFKLNEDGTETSIGYGYSITINPATFGYGGHLVGVFTTT